MPCLLVGKKVLKRYNEIWAEIKKATKRRKFDSDPDLCEKIWLLKSCNKIITTNFKNVINMLYLCLFFYCGFWLTCAFYGLCGSHHWQ